MNLATFDLNLYANSGERSPLFALPQGKLLATSMDIWTKRRKHCLYAISRSLKSFNADQ